MNNWCQECLWASVTKREEQNLKSKSNTHAHEMDRILSMDDFNLILMDDDNGIAIKWWRRQRRRWWWWWWFDHCIPHSQSEFLIHWNMISKSIRCFTIRWLHAWKECNYNFYVSIRILFLLFYLSVIFYLFVSWHTRK